MKPRAGGKVARKPHAKHFQLDAAGSSIAGGTTVVMELTLSKKAKRAAHRALRRHGKVRAKLAVQATDAAGNAAEASEIVRLVSKRRN